jgi:uncharacterized damage-inducible protein DinB
MSIAGSLLPELDHEVRTTRRLLEVVPEGQAGWRPHPKSFTMGELSLHIARVLSWAPLTVQRMEFDPNPPGGFPKVTFESVPATLRLFDENAAEARTAISGASDAELLVPWSLKSAGATVFTMPRVAVLRSFVMNHLIHHRGQLSVYLRMRDVPLPSIYGPTADSEG